MRLREERERGRTREMEGGGDKRSKERRKGEERRGIKNLLTTLNLT